MILKCLVLKSFQPRYLSFQSLSLRFLVISSIINFIFTQVRDFIIHEKKVLTLGIKSLIDPRMMTDLQFLCAQVQLLNCTGFLLALLVQIFSLPGIKQEIAAYAVVWGDQTQTHRNKTSLDLALLFSVEGSEVEMTTDTKLEDQKQKMVVSIPTWCILADQGITHQFYGFESYI